LERRGYVYIMASKPNGTLYIGVTSDLLKRAWEHREGIVDGFSKRYGCKILVWFEIHDRIEDAIRREKQMKEWRRAWKISRIVETNPDWTDLYPTLV